MFFVIFLILLAAVPLSASAQVNGAASVKTYGAVCDGVTNDTAKFQAAATAAATSYATTGSPVTVTYTGNCVIAGTVSYGSGVHWRGNGTITVPVGKANPTFQAVNADDVEWDHVDINFTKSFGSSNPYAVGIAWVSIPSDSSAHHHVKIVNCRISDSAWGIGIYYVRGKGSLSDVEIANSTVSSPTAYSNWDGIHVGGAISDVRIHDNTVTNRSDAAIALSSEFKEGVTYTLSGATIQNNTATEDRVGIDISGAT